jgi:SAM-dependent methyltransferase
MGDEGYVFGQENAGERERLGVIESYLDPHSRRWLAGLGVGAGWRCLDVGAGGGSLSRWLCRRVGPSGSVLAVDLDTRFLERLDEPNLEVRRLDVFADDFPRDAFDLVHARYLLEHLPERETALRQLVRAARPGGLVVVTDCGGAMPQATEPCDLFERVGTAMWEMATARGWDLGWAPRIAEELRALGLEDVGAEAMRSFEAGGGGGFTRLGIDTFSFLRDLLAASGRVTRNEVDQAIAMLRDPKRGFLSFETWTAWGRRAA